MAPLLARAGAAAADQETDGKPGRRVDPYGTPLFHQQKPTMPAFGFQVSIKLPIRDGPNMAWQTGHSRHGLALVETKEPKASNWNSKVAKIPYQYPC